MFIALLFASFFWKVPVLFVATNEQVYWSLEREFSIRWIHSVEKEEWTEFYEIKNGELLLTHTSFKTFGAGVPSTPHDGRLTTLEKGFVSMEINRIFPSLQLVVSENVQSTLVLDKKDIPLYKLAKDYETVTISVVNQSVWKLAFKGGNL